MFWWEKHHGLLWLGLARRQLSVDECWWGCYPNGLVAHLGKLADVGRCVLVASKRRLYGGSRKRRSSYQGSCGGYSKLTPFKLLALSQRKVSVNALVRVISPVFDGSLKRKCRYRGTCVGESKLTECWWLAFSRSQLCWWNSWACLYTIGRRTYTCANH